jgi:hypothetical protein
MKTSVKILLGLVLVIFMIPTVFLMALNYGAKGKNGKDFAPNRTEETSWNRIDLGPSRYIKIASPSQEVLECKLIPTDKPHYMVSPYGQGGNDSVSIRQQSDTLFVTYIDVLDGVESNSIRYHRNIELFVGDWQQLEINGATVTLDSSFGTQYATKQISANNSKLNLGTPQNEDASEDQKANFPLADSLRPTMGELQLNIQNSRLLFNSNYNVGKLQLGLKKTDVTIYNGAILSSVSGAISADSYLNMPGNYLSKLTALIVK